MTTPLLSRSWGVADSSWVPHGRWLTERMTLGEDRWFAHIRPGTDTSMPPIVFIHGLIVSGRYFRPVANIVDGRFSLYLPDLPGVGKASSPRMWSLASYATRLGQWMDCHALAGAIVIANSLGCQVATLLATQRPELVRAMVLIAPTHDPTITSVPQLLWRGARDVPRERGSIWKVWIPDFFRSSPRRSVKMLRDMFRDDQIARLGDVRQPALVIGGERDPIVTPAWVRGYAARLPRGEAIIVPGAPHAMNYSTPRDLVDAVSRAIDLPLDPGDQRTG